MNDTDVMAEIKVEMLRDGTVRTNASLHQDTAKGARAVLWAGMLEIASRALIAEVQDHSRNAESAPARR